MKDNLAGKQDSPGAETEESDFLPADSAKSEAMAASIVDSVALDVEAIIGRAALTVSEARALEAGAVLKLDAHLGDAVELRVNDVVIARGELVTVDDQFGIRIQSVTP